MNTAEKKHKQVIRATEWRRQNAKCFSVQCNVDYDADVIERLQRQPNKQRYIITLIRNDIRRQKHEKDNNNMRFLR